MSFSRGLILREEGTQFTRKIKRGMALAVYLGESNPYETGRVERFALVQVYLSP
jgi:hypothetical protein